MALAGLRTDERQWLIYDNEALGAVMRGLEAMALQMAGQTLARMNHQAVRAIGHFMLRVSSARLAEMMKNDGAQRVVVEHLSKTMNWLAGRAPMPEPGVLDELHAAVFRLDSRAASAGVVGPGVHRIAVRGD